MAQNPINLPNSLEEYLMFQLGNTRGYSLIGWVRRFDSSVSLTSLRVEGAIAEWILDNWEWVISDYSFDDDQKLLMTFAVKGVTVSDIWSILKTTNNKAEQKLYHFVEGLDDIQPKQSLRKDI